MKKIKIGDSVKIIQGKEKGQIGKNKTIFYKKKKKLLWRELIKKLNMLSLLLKINLVRL